MLGVCWANVWHCGRPVGSSVCCLWVAGPFSSLLSSKQDKIFVEAFFKLICGACRAHVGPMLGPCWANVGFREVPGRSEKPVNKKHPC